MKRIFLIFTFLLMVTACTPTTETTTQSEVPELAEADTAVSQPTTAPPPVITVETPRVEPPTAVPEPTSQPAAEPTTEASTIEPEPIVEASGVINGRTPEGAFFMGDPNAPITHIDYSDFL